MPLRWSAENAVAWKVKVLGKGWSSPVVVGDRVFVTTAVDSGKGLSLRAIALGLADGKNVWDKEIVGKPDAGDFHKKNSHASPTPVVEDGRLNEIWERSLP